MTWEEAKKELRPIKEMEADIRSVELEIERLMTVATKMTPNYEGAKVLGDHKNKIEEVSPESLKEAFADIPAGENSKNFRKGMIIYKEDSEGDCMYILHKG